MADSGVVKAVDSVVTGKSKADGSEEKSEPSRESPRPRRKRMVMTSLSESDQERRERLFKSLSSSFGGTALGRALSRMKNNNLADTDDSGDVLSSSCFGAICASAKPTTDSTDQTVIKSEPQADEDVPPLTAKEPEDDDLTNLDWLHEVNVLKPLKLGSEGESLDSDDAGFLPEKENKVNLLPAAVGFPVTQLPPHVPYHPKKHIHTKPPYSFSCLIFMAIEESPDKKLPVKDIYNWILTNFPFYQHAPTGWKNSVRHNLSLNKCFRKVEKDRTSSIGKGSLWMIDPDYRPNLLQALRKTPYSPYHQLQLTAPPPVPTHTMFPSYTRPSPLGSRQNFNLPQPHLFPMLSRRLNWPQPVAVVKRESGQSLLNAPDATDINVARLLMDMKQQRGAENRPQGKDECDGGGKTDTSDDISDSEAPEFGSLEERQGRKRRRKMASVRTSSPLPKKSNIDPNAEMWATPHADHCYSYASRPHLTQARESDQEDGAYDTASNPLSDVEAPNNWAPSDVSEADVDSDGKLEGRRRRKKKGSYHVNSDLDDSGISPHKDDGRKPRRTAATRANREKYLEKRSVGDSAGKRAAAKKKAEQIKAAKLKAAKLKAKEKKKKLKMKSKKKEKERKRGEEKKREDKKEKKKRKKKKRKSKVGEVATDAVAGANALLCLMSGGGGGSSVSPPVRGADS